MLVIAARRATFAFRAATSRIHAPLFWRLLYWALERRFAIRLAVRACRVAAQAGVAPSPEGAAERGAAIFLTGWPHHPGTPWVNLNVLRLQQRVERSLAAATPVPRRRPRPRSGGRMRVGVLGRLDDAFYFTRSFFEQAPDGLELFAFDYGSESPVARSFIAPVVSEYDAFALGDVDGLGDALERCDLDLLLLDVKKPHAHAVLDRTGTPCVVFLCSEVYLRFHPAIAFHLYCLAQADYLLQDGGLFCATACAPFGAEVIHPAHVPFESRGLDPTVRRPWAEREPSIVFHGRLYKASQPYLDCVLGLLRDDENLEFVVMGADSDGALERIASTARRFRVEGRVHYEGSYVPFRDESGALADPAWERLFHHLRTARLAPDPWPLAGATTRLEAYAAGAPVAHMGIRTDPESWGRPQHMVTADHPALGIERGTAYTTADYAAICRSALYDEHVANALAAEQAAVASRLIDRRFFWTTLLERYEAWLAGS